MPTDTPPIVSWPVNREADEAIIAAKLAARDLGRPQIEEMIEWVDGHASLQEQAARARFTAGFGPPGEDWARRMVVLEALLKLLKWVHQHQDVIAKAGK
jgi:hypothetical protein